MVPVSPLKFLFIFLPYINPIIERNPMLQNVARAWYIRLLPKVRSPIEKINPVNRPDIMKLVIRALKNIMLNYNQNDFINPKSFF
jgi:hypothetical protein